VRGGRSGSQNSSAIAGGQKAPKGGETGLGGPASLFFAAHSDGLTIQKILLHIFYPAQFRCGSAQQLTALAVDHNYL